jgi:hypothetical protein
MQYLDGRQSMFIALQTLVLSGVAALAAAAFVVFYVRQFAALSSDVVARSWNESISHLGKSPVYPPQEDVQVGDVLAAIVGGQSTYLLRTAIRIDHIDMQNETFTKIVTYATTFCSVNRKNALT